MSLKVAVSNLGKDVQDLLNRQIDMAVASSGAGESFREHLLAEISTLIEGGRNDFIVPEHCVCPATGSLSIRLTVGIGFKAAVENAYLRNAPSIH